MTLAAFAAGCADRSVPQAQLLLQLRQVDELPGFAVRQAFMGPRLRHIAEDGLGAAGVPDILQPELQGSGQGLFRLPGGDTSRLPRALGRGAISL